MATLTATGAGAARACPAFSRRSRAVAEGGNPTAMGQSRPAPTVRSVHRSVDKGDPIASGSPALAHAMSGEVVDPSRARARRSYWIRAGGVRSNW